MKTDHELLLEFSKSLKEAKYPGCVLFIASIILQAFKDYKKYKYREECLDYIDSNLFKMHCELINCDSDIIRRVFKEYNKLNKEKDKNA